MNTRRTLQLQIATLLALGLFLLNAACPGGSMRSRTGQPSVDGLTQTSAAIVDDGDDGTNDDIVTTSLTTTSAVPATLAFATAGGHSVTNELNVDLDTFEVNCVHQLVSSTPSETSCSGPSQAVFPIEVESGNAEFEALYFVSGADADASQLTHVVDGDVEIDCGDVPVFFAFGTSDDQQLLLEVPVGAGATECLLTVTLTTSRVVSTGLDTTVLHGVRVTGANQAALGCADERDCPSALPLCSPDDTCQEGLEGEPGVVVSEHCSTPYINEFGECSDGDAGSFARGPFECAAGYAFTGSECTGEPCSSAVDCTDAARPICTDGAGCSATGVRGDGCSQNSACETGLCLANRCNELLDLGGDCFQPFTLCNAGLACFANGTCQTPLPLGSSCNANRECAEAPPSSNSCIAGTCAVRPSNGGACDVGDDSDCLPGFVCNAGVCGF
ncbi:MAG: hypothetical protein ACQGVC_15310 [Myxococcota bacterium]